MVKNKCYFIRAAGKYGSIEQSNMVMSSGTALIEVTDLKP
jgi:hypothetical protein